MLRLLGYGLILSVVGFLGLLGYGYFGLSAPAPAQITQSVTLTVR